jgi:cellulose synthase (UDP-forming)
VPTKDFLQNTVGFFIADEKLACVQTPHFFINPTPVEKNLTFPRPGENKMQSPARAGFLERRSSVDRRPLPPASHGRPGQNTITEDAGTALKLRQGLNSVYLNKAATMGLSPESFDSFIISAAGG